MISDRILADIQVQGFSIQENVFLESDLLNLKNEILTAYHNNSLKQAGIGRGTDVRKDIRGDQIKWLTEDTLSASQKIIWNFLENLKIHFNQKLFFGLKDFETHITVYPKNSFYKKHIDQFKVTSQDRDAFSSKSRKISFVIYLNENWSEQNGGALTLFSLKDQDTKICTVYPQLGRAVFFLSEDFPHEVSLTDRERVSMTGWFYQ